MASTRRGEVWLVDLGMAAKVRPALVISIPVEDVDRALVTLVPHTTSPRQSRFEASVSVPFLRPGVFDAQSLLTIPHAKLIRKLGTLSSTQLTVVERAVALWLDCPALATSPDVVVFDGHVHTGQEPLMEPPRRRRHVLEVVGHHPHPRVGREPAPQPIEHRLGEIERHSLAIGPGELHCLDIITIYDEARPRSGMLTNIQAVIFDLDGTLLDRHRSFERFFRHQWERIGAPVRTVDQEEYVRLLVELDRDGHAPGRELFTRLVARCELAPDLAETLLNDYRAEFPSACLLFPDATHTLSSLRAAGLKLGLITNGSVRMQSRKLECLALAPMFDTILISDAEGISKPDARIFHRALERLNVTPARAVFVGDHPDVDLAGARSAGMQAVWRRAPRESPLVAPDAVIEELCDLVPLLGLACSP